MKELNGGDVPRTEDRDPVALIHGNQVPRPCLVHQTKRRDDAGRRITATSPVPDPYLLVSAERGGKVAQMKYPLTAAEPAGHIQVN